MLWQFIVDFFVPQNEDYSGIINKLYIQSVRNIKQFVEHNTELRSIINSNEFWYNWLAFRNYGVIEAYDNNKNYYNYVSLNLYIIGSRMGEHWEYNPKKHFDEFFIFRQDIHNGVIDRVIEQPSNIFRNAFSIKDIIYMVNEGYEIIIIGTAELIVEINRDTNKSKYVFSYIQHCRSGACEYVNVYVSTVSNCKGLRNIDKAKKHAYNNYIIRHSSQLIDKPHLITSFIKYDDSMADKD